MLLIKDTMLPLPLQEVSFAIRRKMCLCYGYPYPNYTRSAGFVHKPDGTICSQCRKPPAYRFYTCSSCASQFLKCFRHPAFDWAEPMCWECLELLRADELCTNYPAGVIAINEQLGKVAPRSATKVVYASVDMSAPVADFSF